MRVAPEWGVVLGKQLPPSEPLVNQRSVEDSPTLSIAETFGVPCGTQPSVPP